MAFAWEQTLIFLRAIAVGAGIMLCYDLFRMLRIAFTVSDAVIFVEDVVFFVAAGLITWFYLLESCRGELRGFVMIGEGLGGIIYFFTIGRAVMGVAKPVIHFLQHLIDRLILSPLRWIWKTAVAVFHWLVKSGKFILKWLAKISGAEKLGNFLKCRENSKKIIKNIKIHLQEGHGVLYNLYVALFFWTKRGKLSQAGNQSQEVEMNEQIPNPGKKTSPDPKPSGG